MSRNPNQAGRSNAASRFNTLSMTQKVMLGTGIGALVLVGAGILHQRTETSDSNSTSTPNAAAYTDYVHAISQHVATEVSSAFNGGQVTIEAGQFTCIRPDGSGVRLVYTTPMAETYPDSAGMPGLLLIGMSSPDSHGNAAVEASMSTKRDVEGEACSLGVDPNDPLPTGTTETVTLALHDNTWVARDIHTGKLLVDVHGNPMVVAQVAVVAPDAKG